MKKILFIIVLIVFNSNAQNTLKLNATIGSPNAELKDVSWITGNWYGEALGGVTEEVWTAPLGGSMMGSFKLVIDGKVQFYELCTITEENGSLLLRIKHFNADLKGWEEKDNSEEFPLVKLEKNRAYFNQLTFERIGENELNIYVVFKDEGKEPVEMMFPYKLKLH